MKKKKTLFGFFGISLLAIFIMCGSSAAIGKDIRISDKTLVAWACCENLTQQGGSILTLENRRGGFDGIVFGEIARSKWMAGSNLFQRTNNDQEKWPAETAGADTLVQIAIVYKGKQINIYRDGKLYAEYTMQSDPMVFDSESVVVIGFRHLDAAGGFFSGSVDDARVYDIALEANAIAALKPNIMGDIKPLAWWSFEDGKADDQMGTFSGSYLVGGASIKNGRLYLDGKDGFMLAGFPIIKPRDNSSRLDEFRRNREFREKLLQDPYRPGYHFVIPEGIGMPFDGNGAIFWKGRYHLFYIFQDYRGHNWGHASSTDLLHWRHHPTGLTKGMFSGNCFINKEGIPTMCYHEVGLGNSMAVALDDELNYWDKPATNPITPKTKEGDEHYGKYSSWDPYGWLEGDTYYAIFGGSRPGIAKSPALGGPWEYVGDLFAHAVEGVSINEDVSCADLFKIGDKHMLLCISHSLGCRYYLGEWKKEQFYPEFHERMSWIDNAYFAPESLLDDKGRRIMWAWIFDDRSGEVREKSGWSGTLGLPRVLWLGDDGMLRMAPPEEIKMLRYNEKNVRNLTVKADTEMTLKNISGNSIEISLEMTAEKAKQFGVKVCMSPEGQEQTLIYYDAQEKKLAIDTRKSSLGDGRKGIEAGPLDLKASEPLNLRIFIDKSVIEVFANDKQAVARRIYPTRKDSLGVSLFSNGGPVKVRNLKVWEMMPSNPY